MVCLAVELHHSTSNSAPAVRMFYSDKVSVSAVKIGRRYFVTKTRCARSNDTLWRARR